MTGVFYQAQYRSLFIDGVSMAFAPKSLSYIRTGNTFEIWIGGVKRVLMASFDKIEDGFGAGFATADLLAAYLDGIFAVDPFASSSVFTFTQSAASTTWTVNHNLGFRPDVSLTTVGGQEFEADIIHTSTNQCIVYLTSPLAGQARCT